jgi:hypothetical protein
MTRSTLPDEIENLNLARAEAGAVLCIIDCLIFLWEYRLDTGRLKRFSAPTVRPDFNYRHWSPALTDAR